MIDILTEESRHNGLYFTTFVLNGKTFARCYGTQTDRYCDITQTATRINAEYHRLTGEWLPECAAIAAVYSVPEGAPIAMAADNAHPALTLDDAQCADFTRKRTIHENNVRAFRRGRARGFMRGSPRHRKPRPRRAPPCSGVDAQPPRRAEGRTPQ